MKIDLSSPVLSTQYPDVNYFEGRLLTARDMREQHAADLNRFNSLGQAIGAGVINGLEVTKGEPDADSGAPVVKVSAGLALNRQGKLLQLASGINVALLRSFAALPEDAGIFKNCIPLTSGSAPFATGVYVLIMSPASGYREYAPKTGLESGKTLDCGRRYQVDGVQFRLEKLQASNLSGVAASTRTTFDQLLADTSVNASCRFQNFLAHLFFGSEKRAAASLSIDAQQDAQSYGALDDLLSLERINEDDVALAVLHWSKQGVEFIDQWAARRKPYTLPEKADWANLMQPRFQAEAEAMLTQFQDNIERMLNKLDNVSVVKATGQFDYLPPAGFLPVGGNHFNWKTFLGKHAPQKEVPINKGLLQSILTKAWLGGAVRVRDDAEAIPYTVYRIEGETDYVLFARSRYAEVVARDVYFDASSCALPVGNSVQEALQQLCHNAKGACSLTVSPETDFPALLAKLEKGQDIHICFQPGSYQLQQALIFQELGHVRLSGAGKATRIHGSTGAESAIRFSKCSSVQVHDLYLRSRSANTEEHLMGAITGLDCAEVDIYRLEVAAASASRRTASCVNFRMTSLKTNSTVSIRDCHCLAGDRQLGILVTDYQQADIRNNRIGLAAASVPAYAAEMKMAFKQAEAELKKVEEYLAGLNLSMKVSLSSSSPGPTSNSAPANAIAAIQPALALETGGFAFEVVDAAGGLTVAEEAEHEHERAMLQGIVVGGKAATDAKIKGNHIESAIQGIHVGLSHGSQADKLLERVTITGNYVKTIWPPSYAKERHAIFVGNANSVLISNNHASLQQLSWKPPAYPHGNSDTQAFVPLSSIEAIRLYGRYGRRVMVQENHTKSFVVGIRLHVTAEQGESGNKLWVIRDNLLEGASHTVKHNVVPAQNLKRVNNVS